MDCVSLHTTSFQGPLEAEGAAKKSGTRRFRGALELPREHLASNWPGMWRFRGMQRGHGYETTRSVEAAAATRRG